MAPSCFFVTVRGWTAVLPALLPGDFPQEVPELRDAPPCCNRSYDFSENMDGSEFCINNVQFESSMTNTAIQLGCVEKWTLNNGTGENHVFHIHQLDFQVIEKNGPPVDFIGRRDTVNLDYRAARGRSPGPSPTRAGYPRNKAGEPVISTP